MTLCSSATIAAAPEPNDTLAVLAQALAGRKVSAGRRVLATCDSRSPDEGLALLDAYVSIAEGHIRQAILDTVLAIADVDPYRRARALTSRTAAGSKSGISKSTSNQTNRGRDDVGA